jgi:hypothetical protein
MCVTFRPVRAGWWWTTVAVLALGACADVDAGVTAGTAVAPAGTALTVASTAGPTVAPTVAPTMPTVTATLPTITLPPVAGPPATAAAATTPPPLLPPPCDPAALAFESSAPAGDELIVTITNRGDGRCEANLSRSPGVDRRMEPDVWLDAGASAELVVGIDTRICVAPLDVDTIDLVVNGEPLAVPITPMRVCILRLTALYPV